MVPKAGATNIMVWTAIVCIGFTDARRQTQPAFLSRMRARPQSLPGGYVTKDFRCRVGMRPIVLFSSAETTDTPQKTPEPSELDKRVLNELLSDPSFMKSLEARGVQLEDSESFDGEKLQSSTMAVNQQSPTYGALASVGMVVPNASYRNSSSGFESATMQVVEKLQDSLRGVLAKVSATLESAGLFVSNRAQTDAKTVQAMVNYVSKEAAVGTGRLLLAATGAASPALVLMGVNTTEAQKNFNDSLQLLSMGIVPDSMGLQPKLLSSFKDFSDDDRRLDAAYRQQRRRRSKPLPAKLLGALPSTINKAADLAYEVEQELKYERAGSRANKLLKPVGLLLPEAKDDSLLLGGKPNGSKVKLFEAPTADEAPLSKTKLLARDGERQMNGALGVDGKNAIIDKNQDLDGVSVDRGRTPLPVDPFAAFKRFRRKTGEAKTQEYFASSGPVREVDQNVVTALVARPLVLSRQLVACTKAAENEVRLQNRSIRAADALLCSTEPIIDRLDESMRQDLVFLEELREVARAVQQSYILAEMNETVEAADAHRARMKELSSNVADLAMSLRAYLTVANARMKRLESIRAILGEAQRLGNATRRQDEKLTPDFVRGAIEVLHSLDGERTNQRQSDVINDKIGIVRLQSAERARGDAACAHEEAFLAACRMWEASATIVYGEQPSTIEWIRMDLAKLEEAEIEVSSAPVKEEEGLDPWREPKQVIEKEEADAGGKARRQESWVLEEQDKAEPSGKVDHQDPPLDALSVDNPKGNPVRGDLGILARDREGFDCPVHDATVVSDTLETLPGEENRGLEVSTGGRSDESMITVIHESESELVRDIPSFIDAEAEVQDDLTDPAKLGLKFLDVLALLVEKVLFDGLPVVLSGGALVWDRIDDAINGAKGRRGWRLLRRLKKD